MLKSPPQTLNKLLLIAYRQNNFKRVEELLNLGADKTIEVNNRKLVVDAAYEKRFDIIRTFAKFPTDVDDSAMYSRALLVLAYYYRITHHDKKQGYEIILASTMELLKLLIENLHKARANLFKFRIVKTNAADRDNNCDAMHFFIKSNNIEIIKFCVELGVDLNNSHDQAKSYINLAIKKNSNVIIELLLSQGAEVSTATIINAAKYQNWGLLDLIDNHSWVDYNVNMMEILPDESLNKLYAEAKEMDIYDPINLTVIRNPVRTSDKLLYDREAILQWFKEHDTSPLTNKKLDSNVIHYDAEKRIRVMNFIRTRVIPEIKKYRRHADDIKKYEAYLTELEVEKSKSKIESQQLVIQQQARACIREEKESVKTKEFTKRYTDKFDSSFLKNPFTLWSKKVRNHDVTWREIKEHGEISKTNSRTNKILSEMKSEKLKHRK